MSILFTDGTFYSMNREGETFGSVLVENGYIKEVFPKNAAPAWNGKTVSMEDTAVFPGFIDTHTHSFSGGVALTGIDLGNAKTVGEVLSLLSAGDPSKLGFILGWRFDERQVAERRFPTLAELDAVQPNHPVVLRRVDGHSCAMNSKALKAVPWKGKKPKAHRLTGQHNYQGITYFHDRIDSDGIIEAYRNAAGAARKAGLTAVHTMIGDGKKDEAHYRLIADRKGEFEVDFILYPQITDLRKCLELGADRLGGCILADGSFGSRTAALYEPYSDNPGYRGTPYRSDRFWRNLVGRANKSGLRCVVHAIGDRAAGQVTEACLESSQKTGFRGNIIIHNELLNDSLIRSQAKSGIISVMQPLFDRLWGGTDGFYASILGEERALRCNRLRSLTDAGITVTGSSDWYITGLDVLAGLHAGVNIHNPAERLSVFQSLTLYTANAESIEDTTDGTSGRKLGKLLPGYRADFCCFDKDPFKDNDFRSIIIGKMFRKGEEVICG